MFQIIYILPEILIIFAILLIFGVAFIGYTKNLAGFFYKTSIITLSSCSFIIFIYYMLKIHTPISSFYFDQTSYLLKLFICISSIFWCTAINNDKTLKNIHGLFISFLCMILAMMTLLTSFNLFFIFFALEIYSISLGVSIICTSNTKVGIRYIVLSIIMSAVFFYGLSIFYTTFGTLTISNSLKTNKIYNIYIATFILPYILFKLHVAPFHVWVINVYENTKTIIIAYLETVIKFIMFCFVVLLCIVCYKNQLLYIQKFLTFPAIISLIIGGIAPFITKTWKNFIAYSSIGHVGFAIVVLINCTNASAFANAIIYMLVYVISSACFFIGFIKINKSFDLIYISDSTNLTKQNPIYSFTMLAGLIAMSGLPPFVTFLAKLNIFYSIVQSKSYITLTFLILYSILCLCYTIRIIRSFYGINNINFQINQQIKETKIASIFMIFVLIAGNVAFFTVNRKITTIVEKIFDNPQKSKDLQNMELQEIYNAIKNSLTYEKWF